MIISGLDLIEFYLKGFLPFIRRNWQSLKHLDLDDYVGKIYAENVNDILNTCKELRSFIIRHNRQFQVFRSFAIGRLNLDALWSKQLWWPINYPQVLPKAQTINDQTYGRTKIRVWGLEFDYLPARPNLSLPFSIVDSIYLKPRSYDSISIINSFRDQIIAERDYIKKHTTSTTAISNLFHMGALLEHLNLDFKREEEQHQVWAIYNHIPGHFSNLRSLHLRYGTWYGYALSPPISPCRAFPSSALILGSCHLLETMHLGKSWP